MIQASSQQREDKAALQLAAQVLGGDFEVWTRGNLWKCVSAASTTRQSPALAAIILPLLEQVAATSQALFEQLEDHGTICLLALPGSFQPTVALRILPPNSSELMAIASRASRIAVDLTGQHASIQRRRYESESQLATFSNRIVQGNAEVAWLRDLATHAELDEYENDPIRVAQKILPEMRRIISARTVIYVATPTDLPTPGAPMNSWQVGDSHVPDDVCLQLVWEAASGAVENAAVFNYSQPQYRTSAFSGVLSFIAKAVRRRGVNAGWLLAVNKDLQHLAEREQSCAADAAIDRNCEFGDFEAGLLTAASNALSTHARNSILLNERDELVSGTIRSLVNAIDAKDHYTCGHSDRVAEYARQIAATMTLGSDFCERIYLTGLLHDVGKIGVPDSVLQKPGRLTAEEFEKIKEHPVIGHAILQELSNFEYVLPGVLHHHEAVDGSGYPHGLQGDQIPLDARILAVADAYDAMTSDRPYRDGMPSEKAESIIADGAGQQWDSDCVVAFQRCVDGLKLIAHEPHPPVITPGPLAAGSANC